MNMQEMLTDMIALVHEARTIIMEEKLRSHIYEKGKADFVTEVDTRVQQFIKGKLQAAYPDVQFMGEENHLHTIDPTGSSWILDPIDGTLNLIYDYRQSAVSLAYYEDGQIKLGVVYNPFTEETFHAVLGQGAYLNGKPISVSSKKCLEESMIAIGTSPYDKELAPGNFRIFEKIFTRTLDIRRSGSAALDLSYVACGRQDGFVERNLKPWDFSAGALILTEAGGQISTYDGSKICYTSNQDILASNSLIHQELKSVLC